MKFLAERSRPDWREEKQGMEGKEVKVDRREGYGDEDGMRERRGRRGINRTDGGKREKEKKRGNVT